MGQRGFVSTSDVTRKDTYPLPRIEENLDTLQGAQYYSTLDLISGFWQVEVDPKDRQDSFHRRRRWPLSLPNHAVRPMQRTSNVPASYGKRARGLAMGDSSLVH